MKFDFVAWLKKNFVRKEEFYTGVNPDPRSQAEKDADFAHEERLMLATGTDPFGNKAIYTSPYTSENQMQASSCVPHGVGLGYNIERKNDLGTYTRTAYSFIYRLRTGYPAAGSWLQDMFEKWRVNGAPLFTTLPDPKTEAQANAMVLTPQMKLEAEIYKGKQYFMVKKNLNIDTIATIANLGHAVPILFYSTYDEWARQYPIIIENNLEPMLAEVRHCVTVLPFSGYIEDGKKYVTIQDSSWFGNRYVRQVSEDFLNARIYDAGYWDEVAPLGSGPRPKHVFTKVLKVGTQSEEVRQMQLLFISLGLLPNDCATGYFGGRSLAGLHAFQNMFASDILVPQSLDMPTDAFGSMCIAKANKLCV